MNIEVLVINSFSINGTGGNPAGVVLDADQLSNEQKQFIAFKAGLSETAFVSKSSVADFKLDFFTPTKQIPHCGHATIATFWYLNSLGRIRGTQSSKETIDGTRRIIFRNGEAFMEQRSPIFTPLDDERILKSIGIDSSLVRPDYPPVLGNTGNSFVLIGLNDEKSLSSLKPDFEMISEITGALQSIGYYVYALSPDRSTIQTRMFAPFYGINEESATGMAAGPLACLLHSELNKNEFSINQGKYMQPASESLLRAVLNTNGGKINDLLIGGSAYVNRSIGVAI